MGSYLSWPRPRPPPPSLPGPGPPGRPESPGPAPPGRCAPRASRVHSGAPTPDSARRLSYEDLVASPRRRRHRRRVPVPPQRQFPARQARCLLLGLFSSAPRAPACGSRMFCAAGVLRMASAKGRLTFRLALKQAVLCLWSSLSGQLAGPGVREASALGRGCGLGAKEKGPTALGDGGPGLAPREEGRRVPESQEPQRRGSDGGGDGTRSAFRRLVVNGVPCSFVPRPGPLRRDFRPKPPQGSSARTAQPSLLSSCSKRNAITSSYSSTRGVPAAPRPPGRAASRPHVPAGKAGGENRPPNSRVPAEPLGKGPQQRVAGVAVGQKQGLGCSPAPDDDRPRKRRVPLLRPRRREGRRLLPSPPQLGYRVTAEDLDLEKRAALRWIHKALEG